MKVNRYWKKIIEYFEEVGFSLYDVNVESRAAVTYIRGDNVTFRVFIWLAETSKTLNLSWVFPNSVPASRKPVVLDQLNILNNEVFVGKFIMSPENGILSLRISYTVKGSRFSKEQFDDFMNWGIWTADEHYPKFMHLIYGDYTVWEVLEEKIRPKLRLVQKLEEENDVLEEDGLN